MQKGERCKGAMARGVLTQGCVDRGRVVVGHAELKHRDRVGLYAGLVVCVLWREPGGTAAWPDGVCAAMREGIAANGHSAVMIT